MKRSNKLFKVALVSGSNIEVFASNAFQAVLAVKNMGYKVVGTAIALD